MDLSVRESRIRIKDNGTGIDSKHSRSIEYNRLSVRSGERTMNLEGDEIESLSESYRG